MKATAALLAVAIGVSGCSSDPPPSVLESAVVASAPAMNEFPSGREIPRDRWPEAWRSLEPLHVYASTEGIYIAQSTSFVEERGIFIARSRKFHGDNTTDPSYRKLGDRVFAYLIKG